MHRTRKIVEMAKQLSASDNARIMSLEIPKYESTKGLNADEMNIVLSNATSILQSSTAPDQSTSIVQVSEVSSTKRRYDTRQVTNDSVKKKLFAESMEASPEEPYSGNSEDDYVPDSADESENDSHSNGSDLENTCGISSSTESTNTNLNQALNAQEEAPVSPKKRSKRKWNKRDHCYFCYCDVLKFSRHVIRHHSEEIEVQEILACNVKDRKRKILFNKLRNKGNFIKSSCETTVVPVKRSLRDASEDPSTSSHLPCKYCKGFYKKKFLSRHVNRCPLNDDKGKGVRTNAQSEGQSLLSSCRQDDILQREIFPTMRKADHIAQTAKQDPLICAVARRYLKSHREQQQFRQVTIRKMRQLASLLLEVRKKIKVKGLFEALEPMNFDLVVECTKKISKYDAASESYGAPSLASQMGTELKDCVDVAYNIMLKKYGMKSELANKFKVFKELIVSEWRYEISSIANNDLKQKKWNKPTLIPLAEDLTLLRKYLLKEGEKCRQALQENANEEKAYKNLIEITYVQLILLNRRRVGELERMTIKVYEENINNTTTNEFDSCISESERHLMKSFKRVVIRGKRGRGVPVLFTEEMKKNADLILQHREQFVRQKNLFLFPNLNSSTTICGSKAIYKHVRLAGVRNPTALTSTKLRKHLATMSQVISLSRQDLEQLADYMGHTADIHKTYYRLPSDVYQMAKVSKLLLLNEKGEASKYKGKCLDDIAIDMDPLEDNSDDDADSENEFNTDNTVPPAQTQPQEKVPDKTTKTTKRVLEPWTKEQKQAALSFFKDHLRKKIPPKKRECLQLQEENPNMFLNKSWEKIKIFIVNTYNKN